MNALRTQDSLYLSQHKSNPVAWHPWNADSLALAQQQNKPIFLSIGYSSCYWCHVMEHDSFESAEVAEVLNKNFISIKVDREERPDLDQLYMEAVLLISGRGGWPLTVFLTPDLKPFFGGTFFWKKDLLRLLFGIADVWSTDPNKIHSHAQDLHSQLALDLKKLQNSTTTWSIQDWQQLLVELEDHSQSGFGSAPKFPPHCQLAFLLQTLSSGILSESDSDALALSRRILLAICAGGIFDHIEGGFHRYAVDQSWTIPHFEKMLYDNAQLVQAYLYYWGITGEDFSKLVAKRTLDFLLKDFGLPIAGYASARDAGEIKKEGDYYAFEFLEIKKQLTNELFLQAQQIFEINTEGNFEGNKIVLRLNPSLASDSLLSSEYAQVITELADIRKIKQAPILDTKLICSWNAQAISALALGSFLIGESVYLNKANKLAEFFEAAVNSNQGLARCYYGASARFEACLDDYVFLIKALLDLSQVTFESRWIKFAFELQAHLDRLLWDVNEGGYFYSSASELITRRKDLVDQVFAAGNSIAFMNLVRLQTINPTAERAEQIQKLRSILQSIAINPNYSLCSAAQALWFESQHRVVVVTGAAELAEIQDLRRSNFRSSFINTDFYISASNSPEYALFMGKEAPKVGLGYYVCQQNACLWAATDVNNLLQILNNRA
jgi:uncharacterized protein YyaL (SSP411 family)